MTPVDQKPNGCYAACIASITGIALDELPHPNEESLFTRDEWCTYRNRLVNFLRERGWWIAHLWSNAPIGYSIANGPSPRLPGYDHSCVALDGQVVHDPHPSRAGLSTVHEYEILIQLTTTPKGD